ncbi:MAG: hypothetical protein DRP47_09805 [Candidatus Zixiibacteriota bacterium]|nr:MAG: hypothetical protein DRP47_09805 [candidate division Zixibacteria bacterium]
MNILKVLGISAVLIVVMTSLSLAGSISMKLSGPGAVNESTIKAGEPVSVDIYIANDSIYTGFSFGFSIVSKEIKNIIHVTDSGNGLNKNGDINGYNGWEDNSIWNFGGVFAVETDWDGTLPELIGFGGLCVQQEYKPHEIHKCLSFDIIFPEPGIVVIDSAFYPPGGRWLFAGPVSSSSHEPDWGGPYKFKVVK